MLHSAPVICAPAEDAAALRPEDEALSDLEELRTRLWSAEQGLAEARGRLEALYERTPVALLELDRHATMVALNPGACRLLRRSAGELVGQPFCPLVEPAHQLRFFRAFAACLGEGVEQTLELDLHTPEAVLAVQLHLVGAPAASEEAARYSLTLIDVTSTRSAEAEHFRSEARYRALLGDLPDTVLRLDRAGRLLDAHVPAEALPWRTPPIAGVGIRALLPEALGTRALAMALQVFETGRPASAECVQPVPGDCRSFELRCCGAGEEEVLLVLRDVTALQRIKLRLASAERMAAIGRLAAGVAHEINNPLAFSMQSLDLLRRALLQLASERGEEPVSLSRERVDDAVLGLERIARIVRGLREFARPPEDEEPLPLAQTVDTAVRLSMNQIRHRARLTVELRDLGGVPVGRQLEQVLINLIVNASHAIPEGAEAQNEIQILASPGAPGRVGIEVLDTGSGFPSEVLDRVFEPFFTTRPAGSGMGLGLSICWRLVDALGGELSARNRPGGGAAVRVEVPIAPTPAIPPAPFPLVGPAVPPERRGRILLIDDEPLFRRTLGMLLKVEGFEPVLADSADAGLERIRTGDRFHAILCDLMMPQRTGQDFYEALQVLSPTQAARTLMMTGGAFTPRSVEFLARLPEPPLTKPFPLPDLLLRLASLLQRPLES